MESARIVTEASTALCATAVISVTISPDQLLNNGRAVIWYGSMLVGSARCSDFFHKLMLPSLHRLPRERLEQ